MKEYDKLPIFEEVSARYSDLHWTEDTTTIFSFGGETICIYSHNLRTEDD